MNGVTTKPTQRQTKAAGALKTMPRYSRTAEDVDLSEEAADDLEAREILAAAAGAA